MLGSEACTWLDLEFLILFLEAVKAGELVDLWRKTDPAGRTVATPCSPVSRNGDGLAQQ